MYVWPIIGQSVKWIQKNVARIFLTLLYDYLRYLNDITHSWLKYSGNIVFFFDNCSYIYWTFWYDLTFKAHSIFTQFNRNCFYYYCSHCGIRDPSWSELRHFINFLNVQLSSCEESIFCSDSLAPDLPGFLKFVVSFLIQMSKVSMLSVVYEIEFTAFKCVSFPPFS